MLGPINVWDYERLAAKALDPHVHDWFAGGASDELTLRANVEAFRRRHLRPRMLTGTRPVSTATSVLGTQIALPVLVAPVAFQRLAHPDGELATARAAARAGTIMCLSSLASVSPAEAATVAQAPRWFQVYVFKTRSLTERLIAEAVDHGYQALVLTADAPFLGRRERDLHAGFHVPPQFHRGADVFGGGLDDALGWRDLEWLASYRLPVVVKGILTGEDASLACEHGAAAVIVSNHGGRQLDSVPASLDVLAEVVQAVDGRAEVLLDGGIRRGTDVLIALALGARAVLAGRAIMWGLVVAGEKGALHVLELLRSEIELDLALLGCGSTAEVTRAHVS